MSTDSGNSKKIKRKRGRPRLPKGEAYSEIIQFRLTADELKRIQRQARAENKTVSDWTRAKLGLAE
jgi:hypothetical protein